MSPDGSFDLRPDVAIVVFGEKPYAEFQGDIPTLDFEPSEATDLALLRKLKAAGVPVVSVFLSGRPLFTSPEINASDAFVAAWLPGTQGDGIADVLVAGPGGKPRRDFSGRLPFAWPADARSPVVTPLFPVGYGLSYAQARARRHAQRRSAHGRRRGAQCAELLRAWRRAQPVGADDQRFRRSSNGDNSKRRNPERRIVGRSGRPRGAGGCAAVSLVGSGDRSILPARRPICRGSSTMLSRFDLTGAWMQLGNGPVRIAIDNTILDATSLLRAQPPGAVVTVRIPLRCFADAGANLSHVANPLRIEGSAGLALVLQSARVEAVGEPLACPPVAQ